MDLQILKTKIFTIRGQKVMFDFDLAELYEVETKVFNQAVKRNTTRFPEDFMFQLSKLEWENLRSQIVTSTHGGRRYLPYVFTEQGVAMLSGILNSEKSTLVNIAIMRTFVYMRQYLIDYAEIKQDIKRLEGNFEDVYKALDYLLEEKKEEKNQKERTKIGYKK